VSDLITRRARVQHLATIAKWCAVLSLLLPALLTVTAATVAVVAVPTYGFAAVAPALAGVLTVFVVASYFVFRVLRHEARSALDDANSLRESIARDLAPTNAGKPSLTERFRQRQLTARTGRDAGRRQAEAHRSATRHRDRGDSLLSSLLPIFDTDSHRSRHDSGGSHHTYDHGSSSHSHTSHDHGSHSSFDGGSFSDGGSSF
jgi:uncharacterized membrane protein YgcG